MSGYSVSTYLSSASFPSIPIVSVLPDIPGDFTAVYDNALKNLEKIALFADYLIVRDEPSRSLVEYLVAGSSGRVLLVGQVAEVQGLMDPLSEFSCPLNILVSSHDFRFIAEPIHLLQRDKRFNVRLQMWPLKETVPPSDSIEDIEWADIIFCEWSGRNAVWFSHNISQRQVLLIRLHGFESQAEWVHDIDINQVAKVFTVSAFYRDSVAQQTGWPLSKIGVLGNSIRHSSYVRDKVPGAEFHLGMLGFTPLLKRPQIALN